MVLRKITGLMALATAVSLASCTADAGSPSDNSSATDTSVVLETTQPQNPLVPGMSYESGGATLMNVLFTGLLTYDPNDASVEYAVAQSITSSDSQVFQVQLNSGWTFHDGTPVTSDSFIGAWNWTAYGPNAAPTAGLFSAIEGFAALQSEDPDGDGPQAAPDPPAEQLTGLRKIDDLSFEITLSQPNSAFMSQLGFEAFAPLPPSFFAAEDKMAWGRDPVGNGPFRFVSWTDDEQIEVTRYDEYPGTRPAVKNVTYRIYQDQNAAYADLRSGNLDIQRDIPASAIETVDQDLDGRTVSRPILAIQTLGVPQYLGEPYDDPAFRQALSMAIDREGITTTLFGKTREAARGFSVPAVAGYTPTCLDLCELNPPRAQELLDRNGFSGTITLTYNADGDNKLWTEAVCANITENLGLDCTPQPMATFGAFLEQLEEQKMSGLYSAGWFYDQPHIESGLSQLYTTGGPANLSGYSNRRFDAALQNAYRSKGAEAEALFVDAERILVQDMAAIPLWSINNLAGYSDQVEKIQLTANGMVDLFDLRMTK